MKLVAIFTEGDGCTYSCEQVIPIERDSLDHARLEFLEAMEASNDKFHFTVFGWEFKSKDWAPDHYPTILTVDEWFSKHSE